jgi:hypothetical protein
MIEAKGVIVARHTVALAKRGQTKIAPTSNTTTRMKALSMVKP